MYNQYFSKKFEIFKKDFKIINKILYFCILIKNKIFIFMK